MSPKLHLPPTTPWRKILLEKLLVAQLFNKFLSMDGI
jgi:hypothetical protein